MSNLFKNNEAIVHQSNKGETTVFPKNSIWYKIGINSNMVTFRSRYNDEVIFYENDVTELNINGELPENFVTEFNQIAYGGGKPEITDYDLLAVYNVTSTTSSTSLSYGTSLTSNIEKMYIDDVEVAVGNAATFDEVGEHVVKYKLVNNTSIGNSAFYNCSSLTSIDIPDGVTSIGNYAFSNCSGLTSATLGSGVTNFFTKAFSNCSSLSSIVVSELNEVYDSRDNCNAIIETSTNELVLGCKNTIIPNTVTSIGNSAFYGCSSLTEIEIPNSVTSIGNEAFYSCSNLTSVTIPNSVTSIGNTAFIYCSGLTEIVIPDSVTSIGSQVFWFCGSLTEITFNAITAPTIGNSAFGSISSTGTLYYPCNASGYDAIISQLPTTWSSECFGEITDYDILAVYNVTSTTSPTSLSYGTNLTRNLAAMYINDEQVEIGNAATFDSTGEHTVKYKLIDNTKIGSNAFLNCSGLTSVTIGSGVTNIGNQAFRGCASLTSIEIPDSVTIIDYEAFYQCSGLTSIEIPDSVTIIGNNAFNSCASLTSVNTNSLAAWSSIDFKNSTSNPIYYAKNLYLNGELITDLVIPNSVTSINQYTFEYCSSLTNITIPDSVTSIGKSAFSNCSGLTSVTLGSGLTSIGGSAFAQCKSLTEINIPYSVTSIGDSAFNGCSSLTEIVIPDLVTSIDSNTFNSCSGLTEVTIGNGVKTIKSFAFNGCKSLTEIVIPDSVETIEGLNPFANCSNLEKVSLGRNLYSLSNAFDNCIKLSSITSYATTAPEIQSNTFYKVAANGTLTYPCNATGYDAWMSTEQYYLGNYNWTSECFSTEIDYTFSTTYNVQNINAQTQIFSTYKNYFQNSIEKMYVDDEEIPISSTYQFDSTGEHTVKFKLNGTNIPDYAFYDLLPSFTVDLKDVTTIGMYAFAKSYLTGDLYIGDNITDIYNGAFEQTYLTSVTVTPTFINSSSGLYKNSSRLISFTTNERIIGASDLEGCGSLTSVTAPNLVQIGQKAFARCISLPSFTFPSTVSVISNSAFTYCTGLTSVTFEMESLENIELGLDIFKDCSQHISITYPCNVNYEVLLDYFEYYSTNCISDQYDIKAVYQVLTPNEEIVLFNEGETNFIPYLEKMYVDNVEIDLSTLIKVNESYQIGNRLVFAETGEHVVKYKLVDSCHFIENAAFLNITSLVSVILAKDFTSIGYNAFEQCVNLHTVKLPNTVEYIYNGAFYNCTSLTSVTLGEYVREIGWNAFERCQSMNYIVFKGTTAPTITSNSFADVATNGTIVHPCGYNYNAIRAALPNWYCECDLFEIDDYDVLAAYDIDAASAGVETPIAFELSNIDQIYINEVPVGVVSAYTFNSAGQYVVKYKLIDNTTIKSVSGGTAMSRTLTGMFCSGTTSTLLGLTVKTACTKMFGVLITDGVTTIDQASFAGCSGLTEVIFPSTLTNIKNYAFQGCSGLTSIDVPDSVTNIGLYGFYNCSGVTSVTIGSGVTSIGTNAFNGCSSLSSITCNAITAPTIGTTTFNKVATNGVLKYPCGSDYSSWMSTDDYYLGKFGWTSECL